MKSVSLVFALAIFGIFCSGRASATGQVIGNIDGFQSDSNGNPLLTGWTCQVGNPNPIPVDIYLNQPYSSQSSVSGQFVNRYTADGPSEPAIASACGTNGANYRFSILLPAGQFLAGDLVYGYGINSSGGTQLSPSGVFKIPSNTLATNGGGTVAISSQFAIYDTIYDSLSGCSPLIDTPLYPVTFPSADNNGVVLEFSTLSDDGKNLSYLVSGQINASGTETHAFKVNCASALTSPQDPVSTDFNGNQWLFGFFKDANGNVFSLIHNEYYGGYFPNANFQIPSSTGCSLGQPYGTMINPYDCTYTALDMAEMPMGSSSFQLLGSTPPQQIIARPSSSYTPNTAGPTGYFTNTNILLNSDGYYYALAVDNLSSGGDRRCPIRTNNLSVPSSWRGWDGSGYSVDVSNGADCVDDNRLAGIFPTYLGYSTYFKKFIMVGAIASANLANAPNMMAYSLSSDFVNWSQPVSFNVPVFNSSSSQGWTGNNYPALLDVAAIQNSQTPNWSTGAAVGQGPWLVFKQQYVCGPSPDPNCPAPGTPPRTRFTAVAVSFSQ
ncbi:hypothetical protein [Rhodanobacter koreensis]